MRNILYFLILILINFLFAITWKEIIILIDKIYKEVGHNTPSYLLTILEKESAFTKNIGYNAGSKENNIQRCLNLCNKNKKAVYCYDMNKRKNWCEEQYMELKRIVDRLGLDINKVPFADDFGMGFTQFQPTTWVDYPELRNKNPWNIEDSLYAAAIKLKKDKVNIDVKHAFWKYNQGFYEKYEEANSEWQQILSDIIFVFNCYSNDYSCSLNKLANNFTSCTENNSSIKQKKTCIKTAIQNQKQQVLAEIENKKRDLALIMEYYRKFGALPPENFHLMSALLSSEFPKVSNQNRSQTYNNQKITNNPSTSQDQVTYQETKREITIIQKESKDNSNNNQNIGIAINKRESKNREFRDLLYRLVNSTSTNLSFNTSTSTQNKTISTSTRNNQNNTRNNQNNQISAYIVGNFIANENINQPKKDKCEDYKNKNYPNLIISEIQFETEEDTKDEFIEIYNPYNEEIDLTCWSLEKYSAKQNPTSTPTLTNLIPHSKFQGKIKPFSFFLITSSSTKEKYNADLSYPESYSIAKNNTILLKKPSGEISDLVGYGDNQEKIYQYENSPFLAQNFNNKSIQRKNLQDTDNNSQDFWLRNPHPENSPSQLRAPREDFIDLTNIEIQNFNIFLSTSTNENEEIDYFFEVSFLDSLIVGGLTSDNYSYQLSISTTSDFSSIFYSTTTQAKFDNSTTTLRLKIDQCLNKNYFFSLFLQDNLDNENKSKTSTSSIELPDDLCNQERISTNISPYKVLISEVRVIEGTSTDEYIELYNPTTSTIDLTGWKLIRINSKGTISTIISPRSKGKFENISMPPFSYLLFVNENTSTLEIIPDIIYAKSNDLTKNNTLILLDNNNQEVDRFSWNEVSNDKAYQRKRLYNCPWIENNQIYFDGCENLGNAYDTDNDSDFVLTNPEPNNSSTTRETIVDFANIATATEGNIIKISWSAPAIYRKNLHYELLISTSTDGPFLPAQNYAAFTLPEFRLLKKEEINIEISTSSLGVNNPEYFQVILKLLLKDNENIILESNNILFSFHFSSLKYSTKCNFNSCLIFNCSNCDASIKIKNISQNTQKITEIKIYVYYFYTWPVYAIAPPLGTQQTFSLKLYDDQDNLIFNNTINGIVTERVYEGLNWPRSFAVFSLNTNINISPNSYLIIENIPTHLYGKMFCSSGDQFSEQFFQARYIINNEIPSIEIYSYTM